MALTDLTAAEVRERFSYEPDTGTFRHISPSAKHRGSKPIGSIAGCISRKNGGYWVLWINGRWYRAHRIAWLYMTGEWPIGILDHADCNRTNNKWANIRIASRSENSANSPQRKPNSSGYKGVFKVNNRFRAIIGVNRKIIHLGTYDNSQDAYKAYVAAAHKYFGEFARIE